MTVPHGRWDFNTYISKISGKPCTREEISARRWDNIETERRRKRGAQFYHEKSQTKP